MDINSVDEKQFADIFGSTPAEAGQGGLKFGMENGPEVDLLSGTPAKQTSTTEETTQPPASSSTEQTTQSPEEQEQQEPKESKADLLAETEDKEKGKAGRPVKYNFKDASGYFEDRMKSGKFVEIKETQEDGTEKLFVPRTPEEFDEVIEIQVNHKLDKAKKEYEKKWMASKSPAWQAVAHYASLVDDPSEILPFIQGIKTLQSVSGFDETTVEGAEEIIRTRLSQRGDPDEIIDQNIESLKASGTLIKTAKAYKPIIIKEEQQALLQEQRRKEAEDANWWKDVSEMRDEAIKAIESPIFGKQKLARDEKSLVYDLIGEPSEETKGFPIYDAIDALFAKKDFKTLTQIALLVGKKEAFYTYHGIDIANQTNAGIQKKLIVAGESNKVSGNDPEEEQKTVVNRNSYSKTGLRFGR